MQEMSSSGADQSQTDLWSAQPNTGTSCSAAHKRVAQLDGGAT